MAEIKKETEKENANEVEPIHTSEQRTEYFKKLEEWLVEAYAWHAFVAAVPHLVASSHMFPGTLPILNPVGTPLISANVSPPDQQTSDVGVRQRRANEPVTNQMQEPGVTGITYRIPPIWKRFVAEFIDSMLLFLLKLSITFIAVDIFDFIDIERYYFDMLQTNLRIDYKMALELTSGILILELIHRIFVCVFEASWLQHGRNGRIGGATPGKSIMRLKVVQCKNVTPVGRQDEELVLVVPGTDLGLMPALGRSVLKNLILAFLFPICFVMCFFRFNRTGYDLACNSIVVEDTYRNGNNNINNNNNNINNNNINNERAQQN
ncbi:protein FAM8A1 isoform X2 [Phymastichus coffea]|nr:protein FAM8A1 isoform X2 [Phymastichus coffea]XP_058801769.1 protein FAM8A1 isoform X2 [Phymastichus coffea]XP_058801770.1 protein FAM8A1 isoform X2 [Phymastichus coffea]